MPYPRKVSDDDIAYMEAVMRVRLAPGNVGNRGVAAKRNLPLVVVNRWMSRIRKAMQPSTNTEQSNVGTVHECPPENLEKSSPTG